MRVFKAPDLKSATLRAKLCKGIGHNYYGEPAWPNDLLYIFPIVILGTFSCVIGLAVIEPVVNREPANPFATPLEILPEWYFYPTFQLLRTVPNKLLGVLLIAAVPAGLVTVPFIEGLNKAQNPLRRPIAITFFFIGTIAAVWLGIGATLPIDISLTLGLFSFSFLMVQFKKNKSTKTSSISKFNYKNTNFLLKHINTIRQLIPRSMGTFSPREYRYLTKSLRRRRVVRLRPFCQTYEKLILIYIYKCKYIVNFPLFVD